MNLHEYQAKALLRKFEVPLLNGFLAYSPREAQKAAVNLGSGVCVVKAQVHAGGRGKAGGVKLAKNPDEAYRVAEQILGMTLVTPQTGEAGKLVRKVWVEQGVNIKREMYLSLIVDRASGCVSFIASREGGVEIEEVAHSHPEKVLTVQVQPECGLQDFHTRKLAFFLGVEKEKSAAFTQIVKCLYRSFLAL